MKPGTRALAMAMAMAMAVALPAGAADAAQPAPTSIEIHGRGDGHGVGLPQDGALALGRAGKSAAQILATFYPGTSLERERSARMHVEVWQDQAALGSTQISLPSGGRIYGVDGHIAIPAGGVVELSFSGALWHAKAATVSVGSGGRSVPRSLTDDPAPEPSDATATPASPAADPTPVETAPGATEAPTGAPSELPPTSGEPPSAQPSSAPPSTAPGSGQQPVGATPRAGATSAAPSASATAVTSPARHETPSATPAASSVALTAVSGTLLDVVPTGADGVTRVLETGRSYRGQLLTAPGELVNDVPLESYLRGLGEVLDPHWPQAGLQALVIAARTYALRDALGADDPGDHQHVNICATDACQVYLGAGVEYPQLTQAVEATDGDVLEWQGSLAQTYYSASAGGTTATPSEGFGAGSSDVPYLTSVVYDDGGHDGWQRSIDLGAAATALHYPGTLSQLEVTARGPSGRATAVVLHGTTGDVATTGVAVASALGLPSTLFTTGFGISAPQVAAAASSAVLPALTAASLGQVAVPVPVIAAAAAPPGASVAGVAAPPAAPVVVTPARAASLPAAVQNIAPTRWGVIVWLTLLGALALIALGAVSQRPLRSVAAAAGSLRMLRRLDPRSS